MISRILDLIDEERMLFLSLALVIPLHIWLLGILATWQIWLLGIGLLVAQLCILALGTRVTLMAWLMVAVLLVVGTQVSLFWITSTPDAKVAATITHLIEDVQCWERGCNTVYRVSVVDENARRYELSVRESEWETLSKGATSIIYHDETIAGRWFPKRVVTQIGDHRIREVGRVFNIMFLTLVSAIPAGMLAYRVR